MRPWATIGAGARSTVVAFFFYCCGVRRALHSFPTRRSSDLPLGARPVLDDERLAETLRQPLTHQAREDVGRTDRKSTRLNSSHVEISYAVFCLKKKNNSRERGRGWIIERGLLCRGLRWCRSR